MRETGATDQENHLWLERSRRDQGRKNHIEKVCKRRIMEGLLAKKNDVIGNVIIDIGNYKCFSQNLGQ